MTDEELRELIEQNNELRGLLQGRIPERLMWRWKSYELATVHFSPAEDGIFGRLIRAEWRFGKLPGDIAGLAKLARVTEAEMQSAWDAVLAPKYRKLDGCYFNETAEEEFNIGAASLLGKSKGGRKGAERRWRNTPAEPAEAEEPQGDKPPWAG